MSDVRVFHGSVQSVYEYATLEGKQFLEKNCFAGEKNFDFYEVSPSRVAVIEEAAKKSNILIEVVK